ncbi:MAG: MotA/TolQ/ExbB proton channel family protein [Planctomycetota bacterium]
MNVAVCFEISILLAQSTPAGDVAASEAASGGGRSLLDLVLAGGPVGYVIILLSLGGLALVVDGFIRLHKNELVPEALAEQIIELSGKRRFEEILSLCKTSDTLLGRVTAAGIGEGRLGIDAVREGLQQRGEQEFTTLRQRNGYLGLIAAVAPMLGLLGTVTGMISSFQLLGEAQGAARPDELALGISQALVTTCMGLILAVPLTFFYAVFRDRINRIAQETGAIGEKMLRVMAVAIEQRRQETLVQAAASKPASTPAPGSKPAPANTGDAGAPA